MQQADITAIKPAFLAFARDAQDIAALKTFAAAHGWSDASILQGDITTAIEYLKVHPSPVVLLVELPSAAQASALLDGLADVCDPETKVITIGNINEYSFYCWLMDIGISSYLLRPLNPTMLETAYAKSMTVVGAPVTKEKKPGRIISVIGARGGVGATTLALNLSGIIAEFSPQKIALVDIDPKEGSIALALDIEPSRGLRDALEKPDRIDSLFIERVMSKPHKNLAVISAEETLSEELHISEYAADALLKELCDKFDVVVLDIPRYLNQFSRQALKKSDHVLLVCELTLQSLRDTLRLHDVMHDTLKIKPPHIIINRMGLSAKNEMSVSDFEKGINMKSAQRVAFTPDVFMQISSEIPALANRKNTALKPLYDLAAELVPEILYPQDTEKKSIFDVLKKKPKPSESSEKKE